MNLLQIMEKQRKQRKKRITQKKGVKHGIPALLSLFLPGLGQMCKGEVLYGCVWLVFVVLGYLFLVIPGLVLHICCVIDAYNN